MYVNRGRTNARQAYTARSYKVLQNDSTKISSFKSQVMPDDVNVLGMPKGTSQYLKDMEYLRTGGQYFGLRTRRGTDLEKDITKESIGAGNHNVNNSNYLTWKEVNTGHIKNLNPSTGAITTIASSKTASDTVFWNYNFPSGSNLYVCNGTDGIGKINSSFTYSSVFATGVDDFAFSHISGRLIAVKGNNVYYSGVQQKDATNTTNLETFNASTQQFNIADTDGKGIKAVVDNGEITFFLKDTGIWALINANEATANWLIPKCNADIGTISKKTVKFGRYGNQEGFIYLAADKTLRFFNGSIQRNSGTGPTLVGGDSRIISNNFTKLLKDIPDGMMENCVGEYFDRMYVFAFASAGSGTINQCIVIDTEKLDQFGQPFWFYAGNFEWVDLVKTQNDRLYGFNVQGFISRLFVDNRYYDEVPDRISYYSDDSTDGTTRQIAIRYSNYLYPIKAANSMAKIQECHVGWKAEGSWALNFVVNSFNLNEDVPEYNQGTALSLTGNLASGSFFDYAFFDSAYFASASGAKTQAADPAGYGHYFCYGFYGNNRGEYATVYDIQPAYQIVKNRPISTNI